MPGEHPGLRTSKLHPPMTNAHPAPAREKCVPVLLPAHHTPSAPAHLQGGEKVQLGLLCVAWVLSGLFLLVARWFVAQLESSKDERASPRQFSLKASEPNSHGPQWGLGFHKGNSGYYSRYWVGKPHRNLLLSWGWEKKTDHNQKLKRRRAKHPTNRYETWQISFHPPNNLMTLELLLS